MLSDGDKMRRNEIKVAFVAMWFVQRPWKSKSKHQPSVPRRLQLTEFAKLSQMSVAVTLSRSQSRMLAYEMLYSWDLRR